MGRRKWRVAAYDKELVARIAQEYQINVYTALLLASRDLTSEEDILAFCSDEQELCDPFELPDMETAVEVIDSAIQNHERIAVYGDYDADGVTATAVMKHYLKKQNADFMVYIPDRNQEGYGMNRNAVEKLYQDGVKLIVTVDNGISAWEEAEYIAQLGMKLVITDHHKVGETLPRALAVVDAHRADCECEFRQWAGVGVAFKLVCAMEGDDSPALIDEYAPLIAIGTIADVVPLVGENRQLVKRGLMLMNSCPGAGVSALRQVAGVAQKPLNAMGIAFSLVPRINAMGRMGKADSALALLSEEGDVNENARLLDESNALRHQAENEILQQVRERFRKDPSLVLDRVIVVTGENWHGGVIGIVAARICDKYGKPCLVITSDGENAKGSGRSIEGFSLFDAIQSVSGLLTHCGGHTLAVGFGLYTKDIPAFRRAVNAYAAGISMPFPCLDIACRLRPESLSCELVDAVEQLEPFGAGNPQPLFGLYRMKLTEIQPVGNARHLRLGLEKNGCLLSAMLFSVTPQQFHYQVQDEVDLAVRLEKNEFHGQLRLSIQVKAIRPSGSDDDLYLAGIRLFESIQRGEKLNREQIQQAYATREFTAKVFRLLRAENGMMDECDIICMRLGDNGSLSCRVMVAITALEQLGIIERNPEGGFLFPKQNKKSDLADAPILAYLNKIRQEGGTYVP